MIIYAGNDDNLTTTQIVGKRIKGLIKIAVKDRKYKSQSDFFKNIGGETGIEKDTYSKYLNGTNNMKLDRLKEICLKLDCTSDYLLGLSPVTTNFLGDVYKLLSDLGYKLDHNPDNESEIMIEYQGKNLIFDYEELKENIKLIFEFLLFQKSQ